MISEHVRILAVIVPKLAFREEQRPILLTDVIEVPIAPCVSNAQKRFDIVPVWHDTKHPLHNRFDRQPQPRIRGSGIRNGKPLDLQEP